MLVCAIVGCESTAVGSLCGADMTKLNPVVLTVAFEKRARLLEDLRRVEMGEAQGITRYEIEMLRDQVRELDALLRDHSEPSN